jgi:hypothetical protein
MNMIGADKNVQTTIDPAMLSANTLYLDAYTNTLGAVGNVPYCVRAY